MNFYEYIGINKESFEEKYINSRLVNLQSHAEFPLDIYSYGRECVHDNVWDSVTKKCRGIIVNRETGDVVARPFEKFFNFGTTGMPETDPDNWGDDCTWALGEPAVWEKVDGFLCTLYRWNGENYIASKGSFTSPHAKWATAWYRAHVGVAEGEPWWPKGYTPVFEGVTPNLRIVVDYGKEERLVLLGLINIETGEEMAPFLLEKFATQNGIKTPALHDINWQEAHSRSYETTRTNEEGYVLTWYRKNDTPFRLKVKFADYLRLHRMVTGVSPKHILEVLQNGWTTEMDGLLNESTPWFNKFVSKWKRVIENEYNGYKFRSDTVFNNVKQQALDAAAEGVLWTRKQWAETFINGNKDISAVLFAMLDGKDPDPVIWKMIKNADFMKNGHPMRDAHSL